MGGAWGCDAPNIFEFARKLVKVSHAARELARAFSVTFLFSNNGWSIGQIPPPHRSVSAHHCIYVSIGFSML